MIRESFNRGWSVTKVGSSAEPVAPVTLPYDAMLFEHRDPETPNGMNTGFYPGGVYRYSKVFHVPQDWADRSITLEFEGVYMRSEVFCNGHLVGGRPSGYAVFRVALDEHLVAGADNTIEVVAHNDQMPNSRWYTGSGIYRPVHLLVGERLRVAPAGLRVTTKWLEGDAGLVEVTTQIVNDGTSERTVRLVTDLTGRETSPAAADDEVTAPAGSTTTHSQLIRVHGARPWSPDTPYLYTAQVQLVEDDRVVDRAVTDFGIRTLTVDARHGLRINGETIKLRGACIHHDNGVIGAHTLDAAEERRIRILKESGYNAIRSAHNPVSAATLRACDRHGMLVMDELTDAWWRSKVNWDYSLDFDKWWEKDLAAMIENCVNHPSVIMYSIGNEIAETATARGIQLSRRMADSARALDPTRPVTNGINGFLNLIASMDDEKLAAKAEKARASNGNTSANLIVALNYLMGALEKVLPHLVKLPKVDNRSRDAFAPLDVAGYNYMAGRYAGDRRRHPDRVIVGTETGPPDLAEVWPLIETLPHVLGEFTWTGWDYLGEAGLAVIEPGRPRRLFKGYPALAAGEPIIDITGHRQTQSYLNEIVWHRSSGPYIAVQPVNQAGLKQPGNGWRSTNSIRSWSWEGLEGTEATVEVYADAARVELLLNSRTIEIQEVPASGKHRLRTVFTVPYVPGTLTAVAYDTEGIEIARDTLTSAGPGLLLAVNPESEALLADGADLVYLPITLTDGDGVVRPLDDRKVSVEVSGAATLLGVGSANPITPDEFASGSCTTFLGRALAVVRASHEPGDVTVRVYADGVEPVTVVLPVRAVAEGSAHARDGVGSPQGR